MIGGLWTVAELIDLLAAKDADLAGLEANFRAIDPKWRVADPKADAQWMADYNALKARYAIARGLAEATIATASILPDSVQKLTPADTQYKLVLRALQQEDGVVSPGDSQDLFNRLDQANRDLLAAANQPTAPLPVTWATPQPKQGSDADLNVYKALEPLDVSTKKGKKTYGWVLALLAAFGLGAAYLRFGGRPTVIVMRAPSRRH